MMKHLGICLPSTSRGNPDGARAWFHERMDHNSDQYICPETSTQRKLSLHWPRRYSTKRGKRQPCKLSCTLGVRNSPLFWAYLPGPTESNHKDAEGATLVLRLRRSVLQLEAPLQEGDLGLREGREPIGFLQALQKATCAPVEK